MFSIETWFFFAVLGLSLAAPLGPVNLELIKQAFLPAQEKKNFVSIYNWNWSNDW